MPNIVLKYVEDTEKSYDLAKDELDKAKERLRLRKIDMEKAKEIARSIPKSMELKFVGKFFKNMVVVPSQFGIIVELGYVKEPSVEGIKRFLSENNFELERQESLANMEICWYKGSEGHTYIIRFGRNPE